MVKLAGQAHGDRVERGVYLHLHRGFGGETINITRPAACYRVVMEQYLDEPSPLLKARASTYN